MVSTCTFCGHQAAGAYPVAACKGDPESDSWRSEVLPICPSCSAVLDRAGEAGCVLKATGERWAWGKYRRADPPADLRARVAGQLDSRMDLTCTFCARPAAGAYAVTACKGDPKSMDSWRREILPVCPRCRGLLHAERDAGRVLKATGERWFPGHTVGRFRSAANRLD